MGSIRHTLVLAFALMLAGSLGPGPAGAQETASVHGYVRDTTTGETLLQANVVVEGTSQGAATNNSGYYTLRGLSPGTHTIVFSYLGYQQRTETISLSAGENRRLDVALVPEGLEGEEVVVTGDREETSDRALGVDRLEAALVKELPAVLEPDVFRSLKLLPGVKTASDYSSNLYIRGGSPGQNLVLLDGTTVYNPTHFFGFFSTFNPDAIKDVQLYKGAYPAQYGGRLGAVLDIYNKDGNRRETTGGLSVGLLASRAYIEGPYGRADSTDSADGSYMVAVRRSTLEPVLAALRRTDTEGIPDAFAFYDINAKVNYDAGPNDDLSLALYGGRDRLDLQFQEEGRFDIAYGNQTISANWTHLFGDRVFSTLTITGSRYRSTPVAAIANTSFRQENGVDDGSVQGDVEYTPTPEHTLKGGAEWSLLSFRLRNVFDGEETFRQRLRGQRAAFYVQDTYEPSANWTLRGGVRGTYFNRGSFWRVSPRLSVEYEWGSSTQLQAAYGRYHQFLTLETSQLFTGFDTWLMADEGVPPASGNQVALGITTQLGKWQVEIEGYGRTMRDLFEQDPFLPDQAGVPYSERFHFGDGRAYGAEVLLRRQAGALNGFLSYTLGRTERRFPNVNVSATGTPQYYPPKYDRTHDLTLVANYRLTDAWRLTGTFSYSTGQAYTQPEQQYNLVDDPFQPPTEARNVLVSSFNNNRLPPYHRLDLGITRSGRLFGVADYELQVQVINAYARRNVWFYQYQNERDGTLERIEVPQIPVPIPNLSFSLTF